MCCAATWCQPGTDTTDCEKETDPPPCRSIEDGECDEVLYCPAGTDTVDCCDAGQPTLDRNRWPLRRDEDGHTVGDPQERIQPHGVDCSVDTPVVAASPSGQTPTANGDGHIGGGHIPRSTGKDYGKEGSTGSLVFALVIIAAGMGMAAYSGLLQKLVGNASKAKYQRVPTTGPSSLAGTATYHMLHAVPSFSCAQSAACTVH